MGGAIAVLHAVGKAGRPAVMTSAKDSRDVCPATSTCMLAAAPAAILGAISGGWAWFVTCLSRLQYMCGSSHASAGALWLMAAVEIKFRQGPGPVSRQCTTSTCLLWQGCR
jgi:hypothetical protein